MVVDTVTGIIDQAFIDKTIDMNDATLEKVKVIEELAELQQAISKTIRDDTDPKWNKNEKWKETHKVNEAEEIADVLIGIEYLAKIDNIDSWDIADWVNRKKQRRMLQDYDVFVNDPKAKGKDYGYDDLAYIIECKKLYDDLNEEERRSILYHNPCDTKNKWRKQMQITDEYRYSIYKDRSINELNKLNDIENSKISTEYREAKARNTSLMIMMNYGSLKYGQPSSTQYAALKGARMDAVKEMHSRPSEMEADDNVRVLSELILYKEHSKSELPKTYGEFINAYEELFRDKEDN